MQYMGLLMAHAANLVRMFPAINSFNPLRRSLSL